MAINTSEIGNTPTDMTNWDPDRTDEVIPPRDAATSDARDLPTPPSGTDRTIPIPAQRPSRVDLSSGSQTTQIPVAPSPVSIPPVSNPQARAPLPPPQSPTSHMPPPSVQKTSQLPPRTEWIGTHTQGSPYASPTPTPTQRPAHAPIAAPSPGLTSPPPLVRTAATPPEPKQRTGWLWPSIAAFVLGGLLTGLGFRIGTQSIETTADPVPTTVSTNTAPPPSVVPVPRANTDEEPAAFVADKLGPSVVTVETDRGLGSGVIFDDGLILTNNHVIEGAGRIQVRLANGGLLPANLVGADPRTDIAVVSVGRGRDLPIAELALGQELEVGELAIAIGSPFQLQQTVTAGIISALNRPVQNGLGFTAMIQTDAPINPGNSGGALANRDGQLIGINTSIQTAGDSSNAGVGFAVPIDTAYSVAQRIIAGEELVGGFLGVGGGPSADGSSGVEVSSLTAGSGAEEAGIREGDRIISIDGAPVVNLEQLAGIVSTRFPGDDVEIGLVRGDQELVIVATLGER